MKESAGRRRGCSPEGLAASKCEWRGDRSRGSRCTTWLVLVARFGESGGRARFKQKNRPFWTRISRSPLLLLAKVKIHSYLAKEKRESTEIGHNAHNAEKIEGGPAGRPRDASRGESSTDQDEPTLANYHDKSKKICIIIS